jgi:uracil DNA glycosylase/ribonuclease HI
MAFSTNPMSYISESNKKSKKQIPASLLNIFKCLEQYDLTKPSEMNNSCLVNWANQGVLLLNMALTTSKKGPKQHPFWYPYTESLITKLTKYWLEPDGTHQPLIFVLWGNDAKEVKRLIDTDTNIVLEWCHPSPINTGTIKFVNCDHFVKINKLVSPQINWNTDATFQIFTDGSCLGNGTDTAVAGWGVYFASGYLNSKLYGRLANRKYRIDLNIDNVVIGTRIDNLIECLHTEDRTPCTSPRSEIVGTIIGVLYALSSGFLSNIEVTTDNDYNFNLWDRDALMWDLTDDNSHSNLDLVRIIYIILKFIQRKGLRFSIKFMNSHQKKPTDVASQFGWAANKEADRLAKLYKTIGIDDYSIHFS